jgi:hypothetical protein
MVSISDGVEKFCLLSCIKVQKSTKPASKIFPHCKELKLMISISDSVENVCLLSCIKVQMT